MPTVPDCAQACHYPFDRGALTAALTLIERNGVGGRDAVHAATATVGGIPEIVRHDKVLDGIEGLIRLDPGGLLIAHRVTSLKTYRSHCRITRRESTVLPRLQPVLPDARADTTPDRQPGYW